jgi:hypothetical protein
MVRDGIGFQPIPGVGVAVLPVDIEIDFADPFAEVNGEVAECFIPPLDRRTLASIWGIPVQTGRRSPLSTSLGL